MGHLRDSRFYKKKENARDAPKMALYTPFVESQYECKEMAPGGQIWRFIYTLLRKADINVQKLRQVAKDGAVHTFCGKPMSMYRNCARWPKMAQSTEVGTAPWKKVFSPTRTDRARRS